MKIMENFGDSKTKKEYSLLDLGDRREIIQFIKGSKAMSLPSLTEMLIGRTRILNTDKKDSLAFTAFNFRTTFFEIYLNFEMIEEKKYDFNFVTFLTFHELMHNFFRHFTRPMLEEYRKKNHILLNILEDTVINEYLIQCLNLLSKKNLEHLNWNYEILQSAFPNKKLNLDKNQIYSVEELILKFKDEFEESEKMQKEMLNALSEAIKNGKIGQNSGKDLDDHETSIQMSKIVGEENESIEEGESSPKSNLTKEEMSSEMQNSTIKMEEVDGMVKNAINEIIESGKMRGTQPSSEEKRLFDIITKKDTIFDFIKIKNIIKNALGVTQMRTYKRIHRHKSFFTGIPLKGKIFTKPKRLIFAIDTSGSFTKKELSISLSILFNYKKKHPDVIIDVIAWSSSLDNHYKNISNEKVIKEIVLNSTGGTVISFLWNCLAKEYPDEKISVVVITDGEISKETYNEEIITDLYFALTKNTEAEVKNMYPLAKIINIKSEY